MDKLFEQIQSILLPHLKRTVPKSSKSAAKSDKITVLNSETTGLVKVGAVAEPMCMCVCVCVHF